MDARDILVERALGADAPHLAPGASSYFATPTPDLDPTLFGYGTTVLPHVRAWLLAGPDTFFSKHFVTYRRDARGVARDAPDWYTVWLAGSGITHQWSAARSPSDLDVLIGVDFTRFRRANPDYAGLGDGEIATLMNDMLREELTAETTAVQLGPGATYEVTWYVNAGGADIRNIHPYAAYDLTHDRWTVAPPDLPADWDPRKHFPRQWWDRVGEEEREARGMLREYRRHHAALRRERDPARRVNVAVQLRLVLQRAREMFDDVHLSRRRAFSAEGKGYSDWYNFRWQAHKRNGIVPALHALADVEAEARGVADEALYGMQLTDSHKALTAASLVSKTLDMVR